MSFSISNLFAPPFAKAMPDCDSRIPQRKLANAEPRNCLVTRLRRHLRRTLPNVAERSASSTKAAGVLLSQRRLSIVQSGEERFGEEALPRMLRGSRKNVTDPAPSDRKSTR